MFQGPKLGEILVSAGVVDELQLMSALGEQRRWGGRLGTTLLRMGLLEERQLVAALAAQLKLPVAHLAGKKIRSDVLALVPADQAIAHLCMPLFVKEERRGKTLYLGMEDPCDLEIQDAVAFQTGFRVRPVVVPPSELVTALERAYGVRVRLDEGSGGKPTPIELGDPPAYVGQGPDTPIEGLESEPPPSQDASRTPSQTSSQPSTAASAPGPASTREILRALTQLLIETRVVDREQLHARVRLLQEAEGSDLL